LIIFTETYTSVYSYDIGIIKNLGIVFNPYI
jgi:hypothetical protein